MLLSVQWATSSMSTSFCIAKIIMLAQILANKIWWWWWWWCAV